MKTLKALTLIAVLLLVKSGISQDFAADIKKISEVMNGEKKVHIEANIKVFSGQEKNPAASYHISFKKDGDRYLFTSPYSVTLCNEKYTVSVDTENRYILLGKRNLKSEKKMTGEMQGSFDIDSLIRGYEKVEFAGNKNGVKEYHVFTSKNGITRADLFIHPSGNYLTKVVCYYNNKVYPGVEKSEVIYSTFNLSPSFSAKEFSEKNFVQITSGATKGTGIYSLFQVYNNLSADE